MKLSYFERVLSVAAITLTPTALQAQAASTAQADGSSEAAGSIEDIIVTAQKTGESVQSIPLAVSAISSEMIDQARLQSANDLSQQVPGLTSSTVLGQTSVTVRGVGQVFVNISGEPGVATNFDGVYVGRSFALGSIFNDLERIEVLRGPQGTLYGRNATGGVVNFVTRTPRDTFHVQALGSYGRYDDYEGFLALEGPLSDSVRARGSIYARGNSSTATNIFTGKGGGAYNAQAGRLVVEADVTSSLKLTLRGDIYRDHSDDLIRNAVAEFPLVNPAIGQFGISPTTPGGIFQSTLNLQPTLPVPKSNTAFAQDFDTFTALDQGGVSATMDWTPANSSVSLKSITAWRSTTFRRAADVDGSSAFILHETSDREAGQQFSQEFNVSGKLFGDSKFIGGLYYYHEDATYDDFYIYNALARVLERATETAQGLPVGSLAGTRASNLDFIFRQKTTSYASFGQITIAATDKLNLIGGIRYTKDEKSVVQTNRALGGTSCDAIKLSKSWDSVTWKAGIDYELDKNTLLYSSITTGFKAGGFSLGACNNGFDPEKITSYEAGVKTTLLGGRLRVNLAGYYYDYSDFQANITTGTGTIVSNAASAVQKGIELEAVARPFNGFELSANVSVGSAKFGNFLTRDSLRPQLGTLNLKGNTLERAPDWTANVVASYTHRAGNGDASIRYSVFHSDGYYSDPFNDPITFQGPYTVHDVNLSWSDGKKEFGFYGKNIFNELYTTSRRPTAAVFAVPVSYAPNARYGIYVRLNY